MENTCRRVQISVGRRRWTRPEVWGIFTENIKSKTRINRDYYPGRMKRLF